MNGDREEAAPAVKALAMAVIALRPASVVFVTLEAAVHGEFTEGSGRRLGVDNGVNHRRIAAFGEVGDAFDERGHGDRG